MDTNQLPAEADTNSYPWPYHEGLRLDEAMNDLTLLVTGLYGAPLPAQDGAPFAWSCRGNTASKASRRL